MRLLLVLITSSLLGCSGLTTRLCGAPGQPCCAASTCDTGAICGTSDLCEACGGETQKCCAEDTCSGELSCTSGTCGTGLSCATTCTLGGASGTSVVKVFEATAAMTGLSERAARDAGFDVGVAVIHKDHHASYYPGGRELSLKLIYERKTQRLLGAEAFGHAGVEKRIDVLATALHGKMTLEDLTELDLAYAPPFSSANDPINLVAFVGQNDATGYAPLVTADQALAELKGATPPVVLDVRTSKEFAGGHLPDALHVPIDDLRARLAEVPKGRRVLVHCRSGFRAHLAVRTLLAAGFTDVANITGGWVSLALAS